MMILAVGDKVRLVGRKWEEYALETPVVEVEQVMNGGYGAWREDTGFLTAPSDGNQYSGFEIEKVEDPKEQTPEDELEEIRQMVRLLQSEGFTIKQARAITASIMVRRAKITDR